MKTLYDVVTEAIDPEMKKRKDYLYRKIRNAKLRGKDTTKIVNITKRWLEKNEFTKWV